jgi:hypothetical protein
LQFRRIGFTLSFFSFLLVFFDRQLRFTILISNTFSPRIIHNSTGQDRLSEECMARKPAHRRVNEASEFKAVTAERAARLYRLLKLLGVGPQTRTNLLRRLHLDIRGFYRDMELLRAAKIQVYLNGRRYFLTGKVSQAVACLPFPDPHLTLGQAVQLAKGRSSAHLILKSQVNRIIKGK